MQRLDISDYFKENSFTNLLKIFPQLQDIILNKNYKLKEPIIVDKYSFYQMILEKVKNYFELKESFIISESINIILKDIKKIISNQKSNKKSNLKTNYKIELPPINKNQSLNTKKTNDYITDFEKDKNKTYSNFRNPSRKNTYIERYKVLSIEDYLSNDKNNINDKFNKTVRDFSTKSNGDKKINEPKHNKFKESFNFEELSNKDINYVYLNLDESKTVRNKMPKLKLVHFVDNKNDKIKGKDEITLKNIFNKSVTKKSNLKKSNVKKELNRTDTLKSLNKEKEIENNHNILDKNKIFIKSKTKTEFPRSKSFGQNLIEEIATKENKENISLIPYNENSLNILFNIDDKDFDIINFDINVGKENTLVLISKYIFNYFKFGEIINEKKYKNLCKKISEGYNRNNNYHTDLHAADIAHTSYIYFKVGLINEIIKLDKLSICALFLSCICHDYKHPGLNNNFLIETNNSIAINYNDISILENMHISETFKLILSDENYNIFYNFEKEKYKKIRKQMISCVLGTDMSKHNHSLSFMKKSLEKISENKEIDDIEKQDYMNLIVHSADISNPTKAFYIYFKWAKLVMEEFYSQGDKEKELGINCTYDRNKVTLYQSQLGFIDFIEIPYYELFVKLFPNLNFLVENLRDNKKRIKLLEEEYNKNLNKKI